MKVLLVPVGLHVLRQPAQHRGGKGDPQRVAGGQVHRHDAAAPGIDEQLAAIDAGEFGIAGGVAQIPGCDDHRNLRCGQCRAIDAGQRQEQDGKQGFACHPGRAQNRTAMDASQLSGATTSLLSPM